MSRVCPHCEFDLDRGLKGPDGEALDPDPSRICPDCEADVCLHCIGECPNAGVAERSDSPARAA